MTTSYPHAGAQLQERIATALPTMSRAEQQVARYLSAHGRKAAFATTSQIATAIGTDGETVLRTARILGYDDLVDLRQGLAHTSGVTGRPAPAPAPGEDGASRTGALLSHVFDEAIARLETTRRLLREPDFDRAVRVLAAAEEIVCYGIGPSQTAADCLVLRLCRMGRRARASGSTGFRLADDLLGLGPRDVVVLFAPGRLLGETQTVVQHAGKVGARIVLITDSLGPVYGGVVEVVLPAVHSPDEVTGETVTSQVVGDALALAVSAGDRERVTSTSALMTSLRAELVRPEDREDEAVRPTADLGPR